MLETILVCCKLYISESRNPETLELIEQAAKQYPGVVVINKFLDEFYNRIRYTIVSQINMNSRYDPTPLRGAVFAMVKAASESIDLELHSGAHPRLGVVDHVCFHPLAQASLDQAAEIARSVAIDIGYKLQRKQASKQPSFLCLVPQFRLSTNGWMLLRNAQFQLTCVKQLTKGGERLIQ